MKKIVLYIVAICCLNFSSCNFLDEQSQDEVRPSTVDDLVQLMLGEGYLMNYDFLSYIEFLSDDVQSKHPNPADLNNVKALENYKEIFLWDPRMYEYAKDKMVLDYNHWEYIYKRIMGCNVVLSMIDQVIGEHASRENLRGQALAMRAFYYFTLVNIYSMPYTSGDPNDILGVPIITEPQLEDSYPARASLSDVYAQIISDLTDAYPLLNQYGKNNIAYRATDKFVNAILSRVYLYMGNWDKCIEFATCVIDKYPSLQNLSNCFDIIFDPIFPDFFPPTYKENFELNVYADKSVERLWAYAASKTNGYNDLFPVVDMGDDPAWCVSDDLSALYDNGENGPKDYRKEFYIVGYAVALEFFPEFKVITKPLNLDKSQRTGYGPSQGVRTSEVYLNRAEANIMLAIEGKGGDITEALSDINTVRDARLDTGSPAYERWVTSDPHELLKMYRDERRRELAFEKHRWFDLRRWGVLGFSHTIEQIKGQKQTVVFENSKKYALPIPEIVIDRNPSIQQNLY